MSQQLQSYLTERGIATSRTTSYNPMGNGQVERYNGTIWKAITTCLKSRKLSEEHWQTVLPDALHSVRSLLCTATNETPHERFLHFPRRSSSGTSVPSWLTAPGPVLLKRNARSSKFDPLVEEVELLQANPHYAHVRYHDGRETTVSVRHLAPQGQPNTSLRPERQAECQPDNQERESPTQSLPDNGEPVLDNQEPEGPTQSLPDNQEPVLDILPTQTVNQEINQAPKQESVPLRRSGRVRRPVDRLNL